MHRSNYIILLKLKVCWCHSTPHTVCHAMCNNLHFQFKVCVSTRPPEYVTFSTSVVISGVEFTVFHWCEMLFDPQLESRDSRERSDPAVSKVGQNSCHDHMNISNETGPDWSLCNNHVDFKLRWTMAACRTTLTPYTELLLNVFAYMGWCLKRNGNIERK